MIVRGRYIYIFVNTIYYFPLLVGARSDDEQAGSQRVVMGACQANQIKSIKKNLKTMLCPICIREHLSAHGAFPSADPP